ncbi:hypothetical protein [Kibdelosporangium philippinense]|uniref:hypothetical protein n=1 Tax=Kibdelosporangium philippinense TaxID=211113 RepID=UPI003608A6AF
MNSYLECGNRLLAARVINPAVVPWRSRVALPALSLSRVDLATVLSRPVRRPLWIRPLVTADPVDFGQNVHTGLKGPVATNSPTSHRSRAAAVEQDPS